VTYNNLLFNRLCLESVLADTTLENDEIVVVDNGSGDGTAGYLQELAQRNPRVRILLNGSNRGFAAAANQGLAASGGEILVLLNNDTIVPPHSLQKLASRLDDESVGMVGPVSNRCGNEAQVEARYDSWGGLMEFARKRTRTHRDQEFEIPMLTMFCVALRKDVLERVGVLDERFEIGLFEDEDYCTRLTRAGYRLVCMEDVFIHHFGQASIGKLAADGEYGELFHKNRRKYEAKWGRKWAPHLRRTTGEYRSLVGRVREKVESSVPVDSTVLVVSRGDEDLLTFVGRMAWHFPMTEDGRYAGHHPADSSEAIEMLERLRDEGGQFLVIPASMFWWLEYYSEFAAHLARRYRATEHEGVCLIYQLVRHRAEASPSGFTICGPTRGLFRLNRRLVTVIRPVAGSHAEAVSLLEQLPRPGGYPLRILLLYPADVEQRTRALLEEVADHDERVGLAATTAQTSQVAALNVGLRLTPGDAVLAGTSFRAINLEYLCALAQEHERAATVSLSDGSGEVLGRFIRRAALRRVGLFEEDRFEKLTDAWEDFESRSEAHGYSNLHTAPENKVSRGVEHRTAVLFLVHDGAGGARIAAEELARAASGRDCCLLLACGLSSWSLYEVVDGEFRLAGHYRFSDEWRLERSQGKERESVLGEICERFCVYHVYIHHFLCTGSWIVPFLKDLGLSVVVSFHDFYAICPTAHLVDDAGRFCGGTCTAGGGACPVDRRFIRDSVPGLKHDYVYRHRTLMNRALAQADAFTAPSFSTRQRLLDALDALLADNFHVVGHGRDLERRELAVEPLGDRPARILCPGNLNEAKGIRLILELMEMNAEHGHRFEFHFLGRKPDSFDLGKLGGICHGAYERNDFPDHVEVIAPSFALLASICEETWSYTLSESWAVGLPVLASDRGALQERIGQYGGGWLLNPDNAAGFFNGMLAVLESPGSWRKQVDAVRGIPLPRVQEEADSMTRLFEGCRPSAVPTCMTRPAG